MSEIEKVAILLIALGPKRAQRILDRLGPDELLPIVEAMRKLKKISPEAREQVLEEVNGILENLAASSFPGSDFDPADPPNPDIAQPELPPSPSARDILEQVQDELPKRIEPDSTPSEIDWGAAGFDFGSGNRNKGKYDEDPTSDRGRDR